jgi:hypothetical protein
MKFTIIYGRGNGAEYLRPEDFGEDIQYFEELKQILIKTYSIMFVTFLDTACEPFTDETIESYIKSYGPTVSAIPNNAQEKSLVYPTTDRPRVPTSVTTPFIHNVDKFVEYLPWIYINIPILDAIIVRILKNHLDENEIQLHAFRSTILTTDMLKKIKKYMPTVYSKLTVKSCCENRLKFIANAIEYMCKTDELIKFNRQTNPVTVPIIKELKRNGYMNVEFDINCNLQYEIVKEIKNSYPDHKWHSSNVSSSDICEDTFTAFKEFFPDFKLTHFIAK